MAISELPSIGEIVREQEEAFVSRSVQISKHVSHSMHETLNTIDAYANSKHTSGLYDSLGREKPFFDIGTANNNIWYRATDIDRKNIRVRATTSKGWVNSLLATVLIQDWMRRVNFGSFLNKWGRVLSKNGSALPKFVMVDGNLTPIVTPWQTMIVDQVDIEAAPKIEVLELSESQLRKRVKTHNYDATKVKELIDTAKVARETRSRGQKKDSKADFYKLYEVHGEMPLSYITDKPEDEDTYAQQMHVISFVGGKRNGFKDFTLYRGEEKQDPYELTHLIEEDGRTLSIGSYEHIFEAQWMVNHSQLQIKNQLDLASLLLFQTADPNFVGVNALSNLMTGAVLVHSMNMPLTQMQNNAHDIPNIQNVSETWKRLGAEVNGISEAMMGVAPKSGTAWRQTEAILNESYNLFELMTENKGLALEKMFRERIIPHLKKKIDTADEVSAVLQANDIEKIDGIYIKNLAIEEVNKKIKEMLIAGEVPTYDDKEMMRARVEGDVREMLNQLGERRFFKPSELGDKTWKEQLKDLEWDVEIDITGEQRDVQGAMETLSTALKLVMTPGFEENKKAQAIVGDVLELTGAMSPVKYNSLTTQSVAHTVPMGAGQPGDLSASVTQ